MGGDKKKENKKEDRHPVLSTERWWISPLLCCHKQLWKWKWKSLSSFWLFATHGMYSPWDSPGQNTGVSSLCLLQGIFPTQESNPGLLHCRRIFFTGWATKSTKQLLSRISQQIFRVWFLQESKHQQWALSLKLLSKLQHREVKCKQRATALLDRWTWVKAGLGFVSRYKRGAGEHLYLPVGGQGRLQYKLRTSFLPC